ncbi:acyl-CoA thioesterase [Nocardioides alcanivorans]|uniref:acyl-CoA thioesterase n=1 Tax=Nocardioides alcanivorans TaxID=2897352 RepID=UPI001F3DDDAD|nr:thioesterase family protein [Nocardioides alcanivorans]
MTSSIEIQARMRDINAGGHVDNVEAIRVIGEARLRFLGIPGSGLGLLHRLPRGMRDLVASERVDFRSEMRFAAFQSFTVTQWIGHVGRSSFTVQSELRLPDSGSHAPAVVGETVVVLFSSETDSSWPFSDEVRADLQEYVGPAVELRDRPA